MDQDLLRKVISVYTFLSNEKIPGPLANCLQELETRILQESRSFYAFKAGQMIQMYTLVDYVQ